MRLYLQIEATTATTKTKNQIKKMNTHHKIAASHFNKKTLRALSKKGIFLIQSTWVPDIDGSYANGMTAYVLSNGQMKSYLEVLALA